MLDCNYYFWQVRAVNSGSPNEVGPYSETRSFYTDFSGVCLLSFLDIELIEETVCWDFPEEGPAIVETFAQGAIVESNGRNEAATWLRVNECWVPSFAVVPSIDVSTLRPLPPDEAAGAPGSETPPWVLAPQDVNCRSGDSTEFNVNGTVMEGQVLPLEGINQMMTWGYTPHPNFETGHCWVWLGGLKVFGNLDMARTMLSPELPSDEAQPADTEPPDEPPSDEPVEGCTVRQPGGEIKCVAPCPAGAAPGDACTIP
jgi:hypothetical protein